MTEDKRGHHPRDGDRERLLEALGKLAFECSSLDVEYEEPFKPRWLARSPTHETMMAARKLLDEIRERSANDCRETPGPTAEEKVEHYDEGRTVKCVCGSSVTMVGGVWLDDQLSPPRTHRHICWHWQGGP